MPQETANFTPRFRTLANELIKKIQTGEFQPGEMLPSERELSLHYDLSRQTIRNAIKIIDEEGWAVSHPGKGRFVAERIKAGSKAGKAVDAPRVATKQIGLICHTSLLFYDAEVGHPVLGLKSILSEHGYTLSTSVAAKDVKRRMYPVFSRWLNEEMMDGYVLASAPPQVQERLARSSKPCVSMGYLWTDAEIPSVEMDYREIHRQALHYLAERELLPACNLVPYEKTVEDKKYTGESIGGHDAGAEELQLDSHQAETMRYQCSAFELVAALRRLFKRETRPKSLILGSGQFLAEVLAFLDKNGVFAPHDIMILVIDPSNAPEAYLPRIAYFDADAFSLARNVGEKLLALMDGRDAGPEHERVVSGQFVQPVGLKN